MGRPAVGKSVLVADLHGEAKDYLWSLPDTSTDVESMAIELSEWTSLVRVIPGQSTAERHKAIDEAFNQHKNLEGVIYVVDWGFTNVRNHVSRLSMIQDKGIDTVEKLRQHNLASELVDFRDVCQKIAEAQAAGRSPKWLLVVVNKVDLFFDQVNEALLYYHPESESAFAKTTQSLLQSVGSQKIKCDVVPICAWEVDFIWNTETIKTNIGGTENKRQLFRELLSVIAKLSK